MRYYLIVKTNYLKEEYENYNTVIKELNSLGRVMNLNPDTARQSIDGELCIVEVHNLEDNIDKSKIGSVIETPFSFYAKDELYTERAIVEEKLERLKKEDIIVEYGHYPHLSDGRQACIHCYLKENRSKWELPEEGEVK